MQDQELVKTAVVGACGKMGRGIALLLLQEMTLLQIKHPNQQFNLLLIDTNSAGFQELKTYLFQHLKRYAEKQINCLRKLTTASIDLVSNEDIVDHFVKTGMLLTDCSTAPGHALNAQTVFEAAFEDVNVKIKLLKEFRKCAPNASFYSNTSSIPIHLLAEKSGLDAQIIGFHFYNPPPAQKLIEIIPGNKTDPMLIEKSRILASRLAKIAVFSKDVPGFIGNGYFGREIVMACRKVEELREDHSEELAIQIIDSVTRDFLLRPMGIFQLIDYVGLNIVSQILGLMGNQKIPFLEKRLAANIKGGQAMQGTALNGIFEYKKNNIAAIYNLKKKQYEQLPDATFLGTVPLGFSWKILSRSSHPKQVEEYFKILKKEKSLGAQLALQYVSDSKNIEKQLVDSQVAASLKDVGTVLKLGFNHLYAPHEVL